MITVLGVYSFILLGFLSKKIFNQIEGKSLVLLSTYFLQPYLTLWGIMLVPLNKDLILSPIVYIVSVLISLIFTSIIAFIFLKDRKDRVIASITPLIVNSGNLGIPLNYMLFGDIGASIATIVNLANIFFIYTVGVFMFARGKYSVKDSIKKVLYMPILWVGVISLSLNYFHFTFNDEIMKILQMGAFASMVLQLVVFGIYTAEIKINEISFKLSFITIFNKYILFPFVGFIVLYFFHLSPIYYKVVMIEILTPLAVTNVNLGALFDLYPSKVSFLVILSSILFLLVIFFVL